MLTCVFWDVAFCANPSKESWAMSARQRAIRAADLTNVETNISYLLELILTVASMLLVVVEPLSNTHKGAERFTGNAELVGVVILNGEAGSPELLILYRTWTEARGKGQPKLRRQDGLQGVNNVIAKKAASAWSASGDFVADFC
jgi:hypothetical protein